MKATKRVPAELYDYFRRTWRLSRLKPFGVHEWETASLNGGEAPKYESLTRGWVLDQSGTVYTFHARGGKIIWSHRGPNPEDYMEKHAADYRRACEKLGIQTGGLPAK
jgi:hypothetical protein